MELIPAFTGIKIWIPHCIDRNIIWNPYMYSQEYMGLIQFEFLQNGTSLYHNLQNQGSHIEIVYRNCKCCKPCKLKLNASADLICLYLAWNVLRREGSCLHMVPWNQCWSLVNNFLKEVVLVILRFFLLLIIIFFLPTLQILITGKLK